MRKEISYCVGLTLNVVNMEVNVMCGCNQPDVLKAEG